MINSLLRGFVQNAAETIDLGNPRDPTIAKMFGMGPSSKAGVAVDEYTVLGLPAVVRAANIISNGLMKLPFYVFKETDEGRTWDKKHVAWTAVTRKPNSEFTAGPFKKTLTYQAMLWGNGCAYIDAPNWPNGPIELIPLLPDRTFPIRIHGGEVKQQADGKGELFYATKIDGKPFKFPADKVIHIRGLGPSPYWGHNVVDVLRETFGGALAVQEHGHRFFGQGANPAGFIEMPAGLDEEAEERFAESLKRASTGLSRAHKFAVLEEGAKFHQLTITPDQAQFLETKELDVRLIAMALGVKVHKLIDGANSAFKSLEQANQEHKDDDLMPWITTWSEELSDKLLLNRQLSAGTHTIACDDEYLEWTPFSDRSVGTERLYNSGIITKDEARLKMNFGPSRSRYANSYRKPLNIGVEGEDIESTNAKPSPPPKDDDANDVMDRDYVQVGVAYLERLKTKVSAQMSSKSKRGVKTFADWANNLKPEKGPSCLQPAIDSMFDEITTSVYAIADSETDETIATTVESYVSRLSLDDFERFVTGEN